MFEISHNKTFDFFKNLSIFGIKNWNKSDIGKTKMKQAMQAVELEWILGMLNFRCLLSIHLQMCSS